MEQGVQSFEMWSPNSQCAFASDYINPVPEGKRKERGRSKIRKRAKAKPEMKKDRQLRPLWSPQNFLKYALAMKAVRPWLRRRPCSPTVCWCRLRFQPVRGTRTRCPPPGTSAGYDSAAHDSPEINSQTYCLTTMKKHKGKCNFV